MALLIQGIHGRCIGLLSALDNLSWTELETLATGDPARALLYCNASLAEPNEPEFQVNLLRAKALAHRGLGETSASLASLRDAVGIAETLDDPVLLARVGISLAAALVVGGQVDDGLALLDPARHDVDEVTQAMIDIQRAGLLARIGRFDESLAAFATTFNALPAGLPVTFEADGRSNRAIALALSGRLGQAEREFRRAKSLFEAGGVAHGVADCLLNMGWIAGLTGNVPLAFQCFDEAESRHIELGIPTAVLAQNRCETFLTAGLASEARATATSAVELMTDAPPIERAEALLRLSRAALADGDPDGAASAAAAATSIARGLSDNVVTQGQMLEIEARRRSGDLTRRDLDALLTRIDALDESSGMSSSNTLLAAELRLDAALVALALDQATTVRRLLDAIDRRRLSMPHRLAATLLVARLHQRSGDRAAAAKALAYGQTLLARHRATIGATELRVQVAVHATELAVLGLDMAFESGHPSRVLEWVELSRSASLHTSRPARLRDDVMEGDLDELRIVLDQLARANRDGLFPTELVRQRDELQRRIVLRSRHESARGVFTSDRFRVAMLRATLGDQVFVSFVDHGGEMSAAVVTATRTRLLTIGRTADVRLQADQLRRACSRSFAANGESRRSAHASDARECAARLDAMLFGAVRLGDRPSILSPPPGLQATPWGCLPSLSNRSFVVTASASTWLSPGVTAMSGPATLVAGPNLQYADAEIELIASIHPASATFPAKKSKCAGVLARLEGSRLAHIASHGSFTADHPMLSGLELADGRLTAYDIERLTRPPPLFVISACHGGLSTEQPGEELMGFTSALIGLGVSNVIASGVPVPDDERTLAFIEALHRQLAAGAPPPDALHGARMLSGDWLVSGAYTCFGRRVAIDAADHASASRASL